MEQIQPAIANMQKTVTEIPAMAQEMTSSAIASAKTSIHGVVDPAVASVQKAKEEAIEKFPILAKCLPGDATEETVAEAPAPPKEPEPEPEPAE